jgi:6-phosphogluconate dehydrogenase
MEIAMIGLGRMGGNMAQRLLEGGHQVVAYDVDTAAVRQMESRGATAAASLADIAAKLSPPRHVWVMVPAGEVTEQTLLSLMEVLAPGDTVIDGGNSNYKDSLRRASLLRGRGLSFVDCGTSGGVWGLREGYCLMIGGDPAPVQRLRPVFETLAPAADRGWAHVGPPGAGHFVKMVHNGIEYGLMQAYAEGFDILRAKEEFGLDLAQIAEVWRHGSVVRSWLLDLTAAALAEDQDLADIKPWVEDSGEGRWTVDEAVELAVPAPVIALSLMMRFVSRQEDSYSARLLAAMRNKFGGHRVLRDGGTGQQ